MNIPQHIRYSVGSMDVTIRNLDEEAYRRLKARAALKGITVGAAVSQAIEFWLKDRNRQKGGVSLMDMKPEPFDKKNSRLSEELDETLYPDR